MLLPNKKISTHNAKVFLALKCWLRLKLQVGRRPTCNFNLSQHLGKKNFQRLQPCYVLFNNPSCCLISLQVKINPGKLNFSLPAWENEKPIFHFVSLTKLLFLTPPPGPSNLPNTVSSAFKLKLILASWISVCQPDKIKNLNFHFVSLTKLLF